jgi:threonine dehydrogenase-like Zn-dependent dehydrogenase
VQAAIFDGIGHPLRITTVSDPSPRPGEVIVATRCCGICGSDLHMTSGGEIGFPAGCIMGHELAGDVVALGSDVDNVSIGDRVAVLPVLSCGSCVPCRLGRPAQCATFQVLGCGVIPGGYAEYARAMASLCLRLPDNLTYEDGALMEPLSVALRGVGFAQMRPGSRVLVLGAGPIGLSAIFWARRMGGSRIAAAAPSNRRAVLSQALGADSFVVLGPDMKSEVMDRLGGAPDVVIECTGQPGMIATAIDNVVFGGIIVILGFCPRQDSFLPAAGVVKEATIRFSMIYDIRDYRHTLATLASGVLEPRIMITDHIDLPQLPEMFEALRHRNNQCKVMIDPSAPSNSLGHPSAWPKSSPRIP